MIRFSALTLGLGLLAGNGFSQDDEPDPFGGSGAKDPEPAPEQKIEPKKAKAGGIGEPDPFAAPAPAPNKGGEPKKKMSGDGIGEPDPFAATEPKGKDQKKAAEADDAAAKAKAEAKKKAEETGDEPDPFAMVEPEEDPEAAPVDPAAAAANPLGQLLQGLLLDGFDMQAPEIQILPGGQIQVEMVEDEEVEEEDVPAEGVDPAEAKKKAEARKNDPVQLKISKHLKKMADVELQKRSAFMNIVIDDVVRLCELSEEQRGQLELAAKGATDRSMDSWRQSADRYIQGRMKGATKENADQMLQSIGNVSFGGNEAEKESEKNSLWKESLGEVLSGEQIARYEKVIREREAYSAKAFGMVVMATLDEHLRLTPEQHTKLAPLAEESTSEYLDDIRQYWGDYFEKSMLMSLLGGAEEKQVKEILSEKQFERWQNSTSNFNHFWEQRRREKKAAEKAAAKKEKEAEAKKPKP
ncbi:MAG: hypothetical protein HKN23_18845 [Verrucomicrobiales bacterium]|nr:hypothetical protein [Verrucomicrobiales bacterium]